MTKKELVEAIYGKNSYYAKRLGVIIGMIALAITGGKDE